MNWYLYAQVITWAVAVISRITVVFTLFYILEADNTRSALAVFAVSLMTGILSVPARYVLVIERPYSDTISVRSVVWS
ncbi:hypothetical protein PODO_22920 [Paenibacillus odorifer]|nr:hypothetical protein PODO_22920 [Paenibacillus odorifer]OZQ77445.1 hypothetical protein CA596_07725 [Paenibacillus odorifer]